MFSSRSRFLLLILAVAAPLSAEVVKIEEGISIELLDGWSVLPRHYRNVVEIVNVPLEKQSGLYPVRASIWTERRRNHDESLRRLTEIAQEWKGSIDTIVVDGWPALMRRYDDPLPRRGQNAGDGRVISPSMTIAVAYGARMLRIEAHVMPSEDRALLDVVAKYAGRIHLDANKVASLKRAVRPLDFARGKLGEGKVRTLAAPGMPDRIRENGRGELEIAVSRDGQDIVIATNLGFSFSNDRGETFRDGGTAPIANTGDPSVAWGRSGRFYWAFIGLPAEGCSTAIATSVNRGRNFAFTAHATLCPRAGAGVCFPDQEHIAADRVNGAPGGDQVYSVWRNFVPMSAFGTCDLLGAALPTPAIVCSQDSAENWTDAVAVDPAGDFPRVAVGSDGAVYVTYHAGALIMLNKFSSCADGLTQQEGFPVTVTGFAGVPCPVAGLDRCNDGNLLASPTVAIDDGNPNHVFLAVADQTAAGNENILVFDSTDGGATWPRSTAANAPVNGRRFMPWMCSADSRAFIGWYDRRASAVEGATRDDLTEYFLGEVLVRGGSLVRETERNLSNAPDPQCDSGWPCGVRTRAEALACPTIPTARTGDCVAFDGTISGECDITAPFCPVGRCVAKGGCPKYGDYNGIACTGDTVFVAWTSATPPADADGPSRGLDVYTERIVVREPRPLPLCPRIVDCIDVFEMQKGLLRLLCPNRDCVIIDPLPKNCLVKFPCPGCDLGTLCPPFYDIVLDGIDKRDFKVQLTDFEGRPVKHKVQSSNGRTIVSFRPEKDQFREGEIGDYLLVFTPGPKHVPGKIYDVKTNLDRK